MAMSTSKWAKYKRSYNKAWEKDPDLKAWIRPVPQSKLKAFCLFCNRELRAHHSDLISHVKTSRHQKNETKFKNMIVPEEANVSLVIDNIPDPDPICSSLQVNHSDTVVDLRTMTLGDNLIPYDEIPPGASLVQFGILTVSDRCSRGDMEDVSGDALQELINSGTLPFQSCVYVRMCVPDNFEHIKSTLIDWCDKMKVDVILSTGGTGFTERDVTPEATAAILHKEANGMSMAINMESMKVTPMAMLSRAVCGIRNKTLIINLPGSKKGAMECFNFVIPVLQHAVDQIHGVTGRVAEIHNQMQSNFSMFISPSCHCSTFPGPTDDPSIMPDYENIDGRVARRLRTSSYPLVSIDYAHKMILKEAAIIGIHSPNLVDCLGSYLVHDVLSSVNLPPFNASIKDGYAVVAGDGASRRKVLGAMAAGAQPAALEVMSGYCVRVSTGAPIPQGANAIVQVEDTKLMSELQDGKEEAEIEILRAPVLNQDIRPIGFDVKMNDMVLEKHTRLGPSQIGILASIGKMQPTVFKKPIVAILSTGSELQEPGQILRPGCIWDSNKYALLGFLMQNGYTVRDIGIARDNVESLVEHLTKALEEASVIITTGGVSMGEKDLVKFVLTVQFKAKIHFAQLFMKPGKPTTFATLKYKEEKKLVFALPGNPVSAVVTFNLLVLPALKAMSGDLNPLPKTIMAEMSHSYELDPRPEYVRAILTWPKQGDDSNQAPMASTTGNQMSSRLLSMHKADALLVFPSQSPEKPTVDEGELIPAILLDHKV